MLFAWSGLLHSSSTALESIARFSCCHLEFAEQVRSGAFSSDMTWLPCTKCSDALVSCLPPVRCVNWRVSGSATVNFDASREEHCPRCGLSGSLCLREIA